MLEIIEKSRFISRLTYTAVSFRDREWQKWPVTIVTGAFFGFLIGRIAGATVFRGKVVEFD